MKATSKIAVFDTTLRDGEQAAGSRLGSRDKITLARQLARLKVDIIEAGFPASSPEDFDAVRKIAEEINGPTICALSRAVAGDIESCGKALAKAARPRIHTGIGVSDDVVKTITSNPQNIRDYGVGSGSLRGRHGVARWK